MAKIAVIGDYDSILGFKAAGLDVYPADTAEKVCETIRSLAVSGDVAIIFITEQAALKAKEEIARYNDKPLPAIILIPGREGSLGIGKSNLKDSIERAVGADIIGAPAE